MIIEAKRIECDGKSPVRFRIDRAFTFPESPIEVFPLDSIGKALLRTRAVWSKTIQAPKETP